MSPAAFLQYQNNMNLSDMSQFLGEIIEGKSPKRAPNELGPLNMVGKVNAGKKTDGIDPELRTD